jgi:tetraacyldisaccharide 4'-kinase
MALHSYIEKHLLHRSILSCLLFPASLLFGMIMKLRRTIYTTILSQYKAPVFIISIGNIVAGGSGKTPFTMFLAGLLTEQNLKVGVSHRGYKSKFEREIQLISDNEGVLPEAEQAGDEAWLIATRLAGIPVAVGKNRKQAIKALLKAYPCLDCIILDDSFQHLNVKHNLDFIIVNDNIGFGNGFVLPAGYLREPVSALKFADAIVLNYQSSNRAASVPNTIKHFELPFFAGYYNLDYLYDFRGNKIDPESISGTKIMLLSGIGNPSGFEESAKELNLKIVAHKILPDHCDYNEQKLRKDIIATYHKSGAKWLLTTEKDYAKLRRFNEFSDCLLILGISFVLDKEADKLTEYIMRKLIKCKEAV